MSMSSLRPSDSLPAQLCNAGNERKCQDRLRPCGENVSPFPRQTNEQAVCPEGKYPNPKHQPPKETPNLNHQGSVRAIWNLELGISLAIGILAVGDSASRWLSSRVIIWLNCDWLAHFDAVAIEPKSSLTAD